MTKTKEVFELEKEAQEYQKIAKSKRLKWQKKKNPMTHLTPKKKKRK